jgi:hypothetical protein
MKKYLLPVIISIAAILIYQSIFAEQNSAYAQQAQKPKVSEPNKDDLDRLLRERFKAAYESALKDPNYIKILEKRRAPDLNEAYMAKLEQERIDADNEHYKDRIFGNPFRGLAMSIAPAKAQYEIGNEIEISILVKNFGSEKIILKEVRGDDTVLDNFQYALYFPDGNSVPKSDCAKKLEVDIENAQRKFVPSTPSIVGSLALPGEILQIYKPIVGRYFKIEKEGTYFLIAMRRTTESWQDGFMISNMTKINIIAKKEK